MQMLRILILRVSKDKKSVADKILGEHAKGKWRRTGHGKFQWEGLVPEVKINDIYGAGFTVVINPEKPKKKKKR